MQNTIRSGCGFSIKRMEDKKRIIGENRLSIGGRDLMGKPDRLVVAMV